MADIIETIDGQLTRLENAKRDIITALENQGVKVPEGASLDEFPALINEIITGVSAEELDKILEDYALASELEKQYVTTDTEQVINANKTILGELTVTDSTAPGEATAATYWGGGVTLQFGRYDINFPWCEEGSISTFATEEYVQDQLKNLDPGVSGGEVTAEEFDKLENTVQDHENRISKLEDNGVGGEVTQEELDKVIADVQDHEDRITKLEDSGTNTDGDNRSRVQVAESYNLDYYTVTDYYSDGILARPESYDEESLWLEFPTTRSGEEVIATEQYVQEQLKNFEPGMGGGDVSAEEFDKLEKMVDEVYHNYTHISEHTVLEDRVEKLEDNVSAPTTKEPYGSDMYYSATLWADGIEVNPIDDNPAFLEFPLYESGTIATQEYVQEEIKKSLDNGIGSGSGTGSGAGCNCPEITINDYQPEKLNFYAPEYSGEWGQVPMFNPEIPDTEWVWLSDWAPTRSEFEKLEQRVADQDIYIEKLEKRIAALADIVNKL